MSRSTASSAMRRYVVNLPPTMLTVSPSITAWRRDKSAEGWSDAASSGRYPAYVLKMSEGSKGVAKARLMVASRKSISS